MFPEPWHLSYAPLSVPALQAMSVDLLADTLRNADLSGKATVLALLPELYRNHILNIADAPTA